MTIVALVSQRHDLYGQCPNHDVLVMGLKGGDGVPPRHFGACIRLGVFYGRILPYGERRIVRRQIVVLFYERSIFMDQREVAAILEICQEVDRLISEDIGTADLEVIEKYRLRMNDHLYNHRWKEAEDAAYGILLLRNGEGEHVVATIAS